MDNASTIEQLLEKYASGQCSQSGEEVLLRQLAATTPAERLQLLRRYEEIISTQFADGVADETMLHRIWSEINKREHESPVSIPLYSKWFRMAAAAAVLAMLGVAIWWIAGNKTTPSPTAFENTQKDIDAPASARAIITLANGKQVYIDSAGNGLLATEGNVQVVKSEDGEIAYRSEAAVQLPRGEMLYNTITVPRGSRIVSLTLSDGSKVWLNSESSLRYPVTFAGNERRVQMEGEAYFEVQHDPSKPFLVARGDVQVKVLGTHFNVNAYADEDKIKVTLLEGSIQLKAAVNPEGIIIRPGQQAQVDRDQPVYVTGNIDLDQVMAWKNGLFSFSGADLPAIMRQLSRWYNIEVSYAGAVPSGTFEGKIGRDLSLTQLLNGLGSTRIHYRLEGNRLTILPE